MNRSPPAQSPPNPVVVPNQIPMDSLELIRNRLNQVFQSLRKLSEQISYSQRNPNAKLPSYLAMLTQFQVLITQLQTIVSQLDANDEVLRSTNVYPLPNFPTTQQEGLVTTLLRKKPLPEVDAWIDAAILESKEFKLPIQKDDEFAEWCHSKVKELEEQFNFDGFHSKEELEFLETEEGQAEQAKKKEIEDEKEARDRAISGTGTPLQPNAVLKFMNRGILE